MPKQWYKKCHITQKERVRIYGYIQQNLFYREMWRLMNRHHTSISREIKRNSIDKGWWVYEYCPLEADKRRLERRRKANILHILLRRDRKQRELLERLLEEKWESWWPDEILWRIESELWRKTISTPTFYRYIRIYKPSLQRLLRHKSDGYKPRDVVDWRSQFLADVPLITERSENINNREEIGDWEFDTVVSNKKVKGWLVTWLDRKSRYLRMRKCHNLEAETVYWIMRYLLRNEKLNSVTIDNGREFAKILLLAKVLAIEAFRCHPYSSREKGTNEKHNWFIRRFIPKWCDISQYSDKEIQAIEDKLNHKPRKILGYKTPYEVYHNVEIKYLT